MFTRPGVTGADKARSQPPVPAIDNNTSGALCSGLAALPSNAAAVEVRMCGHSRLLCRPSPGQHAGPLRVHWSLPAALPHPAGGEARHVQPRRRALRHAAPHRRAPPRLQLRLPRAALPHTNAISTQSNGSCVLTLARYMWSTCAYRLCTVEPPCGRPPKHDAGENDHGCMDKQPPELSSAQLMSAP